MSSTSSNEQTSSKGTGLPAWVAPVAIAIVVAAIFFGGKKNDDIVENPLVDLAILTVGVFAFAAGFRWAATKLNAPGLATFFGQPVAISSNSPAY